MGWAYGKVKGREVGYSVEATCDHPGCNEEIDRGLSYCCGDMHGGGNHGCGKYFCEEHRSNMVRREDGHYESVCDECAKAIVDYNDDWWEDPEEGVICKKPDHADAEEDEPEKV